MSRQPISDFGLVLARCIGARLKDLRTEAELTQREIGEATGFPRPVVGRLEHGLHVPSLESIRAYAAALGVDAMTVLVCLDPEWQATCVRVRREMRVRLVRTDARGWACRVSVRRGATCRAGAAA